MTGTAVHTHHPSRMGLEPLPFADWLRPQDGDGALLALRERLIALHDAHVVAALPEAAAAVAELREVLRNRGHRITDAQGPRATLAAIGRAVAEDLCILTESGTAYRLTAGVLCFPNRWKLTEKIGGSILAVHGPVPDYEGELSAGVDRFLARLKHGRAYMRHNWGLAASPELFLPEPTPSVDPHLDRDAFLRREEQSFLKLPETGTVIFGIRTTVTPWIETPEPLRSEILATIEGLSPSWRSYKSLTVRP
jgi:dimethylamine monooxygenase subunit A